jgi:DNA-binding NtrC family response regulator
MAVQPYFFPQQLLACVAASPAPGTTYPDWPARHVVHPPATFADAHRSFEFQYLTQALREHRGNISRTARAIGMTRRNLQNKIQKLGIDVEELKAVGA